MKRERGRRKSFYDVTEYSLILVKFYGGVSVFEDEGFLSMRMRDWWLPSLLLLLLAANRARVVSFTNYRWSYCSYVCGGETLLSGSQGRDEKR